MPQKQNSTLADLIETALEDHTLAFKRHDSHRGEIDVCKCGTQHPPYDNGRFITHTRHQAEVAAEAAEEHFASLAR